MATDTAPSPERPAPPYTTPPNLRNAGYLLAALFAALTVLWVALLTFDELARDEKRTTRSLGPIQTVQLETDSGEITVREGRGPDAVLETTEWSGLFGGPDVEVRSQEGRLVVTSDCPDVLTTACGAEHTLLVPRGVPVRLRTGSGDIEVESITGDADLDTGSGEILVERLRGGDLDARTGSGDIELARLDAGAVRLRTGSGEVSVDSVRARTIEARTGSGDIDLAVDGTPPGSIFAKTGSGEVSLLLPDAAYAVNTSTGSGDEDVAVRQDPDAPNRVDVQTGSGDVQVAQR